MLSGRGDSLGHLACLRRGRYMKWSEKKKNRAFETLFTYGGRHRTWLLRGTTATIGVVIFRLLMPWPLRGVIEVVFPEGSHKGAAMVQYLPEWGSPV
ncbi:MAG: hypothetical protein ACE5DR_04570, partial [Thermodesulfobacteriota bacterium]